MKRLPRIVNIISVRKFVIRVLWNNGEIRDIDFKPLIAEWKKNKEKMYDPLADPKVFKTVAVSPERTLCWPEVKIKIQFKGAVKEHPLDLDPDVLFEKSRLIERYERPHIGHMLKTAREDAGLSQIQVANNSGTSRTYISRIENDHSDIQLDVFFKIVKLGMGKELKVSIV